MIPPGRRGQCGSVGGSDVKNSGMWRSEGDGFVLSLLVLLLLRWRIRPQLLQVLPVKRRGCWCQREGCWCSLDEGAIDGGEREPTTTGS